MVARSGFAPLSSLQKTKLFFKKRNYKNNNNSNTGVCLGLKLRGKKTINALKCVFLFFVSFLEANSRKYAFKRSWLSTLAYRSVFSVQSETSRCKVSLGLVATPQEEEDRPCRCRVGKVGEDEETS